jgi:hypothetical protein
MAGSGPRKTLPSILIPGVYACFPCSILTLTAEGACKYGWHDDYWDSPLHKNASHFAGAPLRDELVDGPFTGTWTGSGAQLEGTVGWEMYGAVEKSLRFKGEVRNDNQQGNKEGIAAITLEVDFFETSGKLQEHKTFFLIHKPRV